MGSSRHPRHRVLSQARITVQASAWGPVVGPCDLGQRLKLSRLQLFLLYIGAGRASCLLACEQVKLLV